MPDPNANASPQSIADKLDGVDSNGNPLSYDLVDLLAPSGIFSLGTTYAYPEGRNTSSSFIDHENTLAKILSRTFVASDGHTYDIFDAVMTILESVLK